MSTWLLGLYNVPLLLTMLWQGIWHLFTEFAVRLSVGQGFLSFVLCSYNSILIGRAKGLDEDDDDTSMTSMRTIIMI